MRRTGTGRRAGSSRSVVFRKPLGSATGHLQNSVPYNVAVGVQALGNCCVTGFEHRGVVARKHLGEAIERGVALLEQSLGEGGSGLVDVLAQQIEKDLAVGASELEQVEFTARKRVRVDPATVEVVDVGGAARHTRSEVASGLAEDHGETAGHVLERVVTDAFDDSGRS